MKGIKVLNISFILAFVIFIYFAFMYEIELFLPILIISFTFFIVARMLMFSYILKENKILLKVKFPSKTFKEFVFVTIWLIVSLLFIINYWFSFIVEGRLTIIPGILSFFYVVQSFKATIIFSNDYVVLNGGSHYDKWCKITEYKIKENTLTIRTAYTPYKINFSQIPEILQNDVIKVLNKKLSKIFNGNLYYENQELKVIENKNC